MSYGPWRWTWEIQRADDAKRQRRRTRSHFMNALIALTVGEGSLVHWVVGSLGRWVGRKSAAHSAAARTSSPRPSSSPAASLRCATLFRPTQRPTAKAIRAFMNAADYIYIAIAVVRAIPGMIYYSCFYRRSK